ncbi:MAG: hypothetical protein AAB731_04425 [Patescibacteria group bacterium]
MIIKLATAVSVFLFGLAAITLFVEFMVSYRSLALAAAVLSGLASYSSLRLALEDRFWSIDFLQEQKFKRDMAKLEQESVNQE